MADEKITLQAIAPDGTVLAEVYYDLERYKQAIHCYDFEEVRPAMIKDPSNPRRQIPNPVTQGQYLGLDIINFLNQRADQAAQFDRVDAQPAITPDNVNEHVKILVPLE